MYIYICIYIYVHIHICTCIYIFMPLLQELRESGLTVAITSVLRLAGAGGGPKGAMKRMVCMLQQTATHCNTLQYTAACCSTLQRTAARCSHGVMSHT